MERFCSRGQHRVQIYCNKRQRLHKKEFNSHRIDSEHQRGPRFIVLVHQYGGRDVTVKMLYKKITTLINSVSSHFKILLNANTSVTCSHKHRQKFV